MKFALVAVVATIGLAGCATSPNKIAPSYVSPVTYSGYSCTELAEEAQRVSVRAAQASGQQRDQATRDTVAVTAAVIVFWPALFFVGGDKTNANELASLKGQMDAIEQVSIAKKCGITFQRG